MFHNTSRYEPYNDFEDAGYLALKVGDTQFVERFGQARVTLESPVAKRYGGTMYKNIHAEWYVTGYATRAVRVATEVCASWTATEHVKPRFVHSKATGDEGFYGPASAAQAERAILGVYKTLKNIEAFQLIFKDADTGVRSVDSSVDRGWTFDEF
jgi:hypothetical protein